MGLVAATAVCGPVIYKEPFPTYSSVFYFPESGGFEEATLSKAIFTRQRQTFYGAPDGRIEISPEGLFQYESSEIFNYATVEVRNDDRKRTPLFGELQSGALKRMLANGYISAKEYNELQDLDGYSNNPVLVSRIYSELSLSEAEKLFGKGKIPWERVFDGSGKMAENGEGEFSEMSSHFSKLKSHFENSGEKLKILRSSVVVFLGQKWDPKTEKYVPLDLPLKKSAEFAALANFDREKFPLTAQIGRAVSEGEPLKGVFHHALQAVIPYFQYQAAQARIQEDRFLVMNTVDDDAHVRVYASSLNLRILDADLKTRLEANDPNQASKVISETPNATNLRAAGKSKYLMVGTVGAGQSKMGASDFSWMKYRLKQDLLTPSKPVDTLSAQIHRTFYRHIYSLLDVRLPDAGASLNSDAVLMMNLDHSLIASYGLQDLQNLGQWRDGSLEEILNHLMKAAIPSGAVGSKNPKLLIPLDLIKSHEPSILVQKIDAAQYQRHGEIYLATIALAAWKQWEEGVAALPEVMPEYSIDIAHGWLDFRAQASVGEESSTQKQFTKVKTMNRAAALARRPRIFFLSDDPKVIAGFQNLGGKKSSAVRAEVLAEELKKELEIGLETIVTQAMERVKAEADRDGIRSQAELQQRLNRLVNEAMASFSGGSQGFISDLILKKLQLSKASAMEFSAPALESIKERFPFLWSQIPVSRRGHQICEESLWSAFP